VLHHEFLIEWTRCRHELPTPPLSFSPSRERLPIELTFEQKLAVGKGLSLTALTAITCAVDSLSQPREVQSAPPKRRHFHSPSLSKDAYKYYVETGCSIHDAAAEFSIAYSTFRRHVHLLKSGGTIKPPGRQALLPEADERTLCLWVMHRAEQLAPVTLSELRRALLWLAKERKITFYTRSGVPSIKLIKGMVKRFIEAGGTPLILNKSRPQKHKVPEADVIQSFYKNLTKVHYCY
jgi:transposase